jgi:hypothetical protein
MNCLKIVFLKKIYLKMQKTVFLTHRQIDTFLKRKIIKVNLQF